MAVNAIRHTPNSTDLLILEAAIRWCVDLLFIDEFMIVSSVDRSVTVPVFF
jgi:hypothetical protein